MGKSRVSLIIIALMLLLNVLSTNTHAAKIAYIHGNIDASAHLLGDIDYQAPPFHQMLLNSTHKRTGCSKFKAMVQGEGHTITQHYDQEITMNASWLDKFDVVIFSLHQKIWSTTEKAALATWINTGGGILIYSDGAAGGQTAGGDGDVTVGQTVVNNILSEYGMQVLQDQGGGQRSYQPKDSDPHSDHPIVEGLLILEGEGVSPIAIDPTVDDIEVLIPCDVQHLLWKLKPNKPDDVIKNNLGITIKNPSWACLAFKPVGNGKIVALFDRQPVWNGDIDWDSNDGGPEHHNREILRRTVNYLSESTSTSDMSIFALNNNSGFYDFEFYPNPTNSGSITIEKTSYAEVVVSIININGKEQKRFTMKNSSIHVSVSDMLSGIYFIRLLDANSIVTKKLVIN